MKVKYLILLVFMAMNWGAKAQSGSKKFFRDCTQIKTYYARNGDTVVFACDSIRLYNPNSFSSLQKAYSRLYKTSNELALKTDSASLIFKNLYEEKSRQYELLQQSYALFRQKTENHILATDSNVLSIKNNSLQAKMQLEKADSLISNGIQKMEKFNANLWKTKMKYAGVGFFGGLLTGVFLSMLF
ncbi:MAG: hypothetical protein ACOVP1_01280 [Bacteroidia bacterium]